MRILFLESHPMWIYGLPNGFVDNGHDVLISGPLTESNISEMINEFKPDLIFTMGHTPENGSALKQKWINKAVAETNIPHIYWATEDPRYTPTFSLPLIETMKPDFVFTICPPRIEYYKEKGIEAEWLDFGYHSNVHYSLEKPEKDYDCSIAIVANAYPKLYEEVPNHTRFQYLSILIEPLIRANIRVDFWGRYWKEMSDILKWDIPEEWIHGYLSYTEANKVYSSADITIGLQNLPTQLTQRTYEVLGSRGLLLTVDTPAIRKLFKPNEDLLVTNSAKQTLDLVDFYLMNSEKREKIKANGCKKVANYSYQKRAKYIMQVLYDRQIIKKKEECTDLPGTLTNYIDLLKKKYEIYIVEKGDNLWRISKKLGVSIDSIKKLNYLMSDVIYPGNYLKVKLKNN